MRRSIINTWWTRRVIPTLPTLRVFTRFLWGLLLVMAILVLFKYLFFTNCLTVGSVNACVTSAINSSDTFFAIGGILVAIVALIPTFWIDGKIRDAKKEVGQQIFEDVRESMQRLSRAQMLIFEADKYQDVGELLSKELLIVQAVSLWPPLQQEERRKLGNSFSLAVIEGFYLGLRSTVASMLKTSLQREQIRVYLTKAISYLEETIQNAEAPSREELVNLACMYGCAVRYNDMIRAIERAIKVDENARDDFQEAKRLSLLMSACVSDRRLIEKLGKKIGKDLPISKAEFTNIINKVDLTNRAIYLNFFAMKRQRAMIGENVYIIKITPADVQGKRVLSGLYCTVIETKDVHNIPSAGQQASIEDFFDEVDKELFVICFSED